MFVFLCCPLGWCRVLGDTLLFHPLRGVKCAILREEKGYL